MRGALPERALSCHGSDNNEVNVMKTSIKTGRWVVALSIAVLGACGGGGGGGGGAAATPGTIQLTEISFDATEGTVVNILVARTGGNSGVVSVDYATADGTAAAGSDYTAASGTLTWANGVGGNQTISIPITDDDSAEATESFTVTLSNVSVATLGADSSATVNIIDTDGVAQLPITPANAQDVTADVLEAISSVFDLIDVANLLDLPFPDLPAEKGGLGATSGSPFAKLGDRRIVRKTVTVVALQAIIVESVGCDSGTATTIWDDADNNLEISTGDTLDVSFENCFFSDLGVTLVGDASITNIEITGDVANAIPPWSLSAIFTLTGLEGVEGNETVIIDGGLDLLFSSNDAITIDGSVSGASLNVMSNGTAETLSDFNFPQVIDLNTQTVTADASGMLTSTELNGTVEFETLASFVIIADDNPSAGQLFISDVNSSVLATVLDNISVQLEVDEDADGTAETTFVVTWDDLGID